MNVYVIMALAFLVAFGFTFASVPIAKIVAGKIGAIDVPRDGRRMHKKATPRLGGIAVFFGFLVSLLCFCGITRDLIAVLIGAIIILVLGIIDDSRGLSAKVKFCVQIVAALVVVFGGDIRIEVFTNPNLFSDLPFLQLNDWVSIPFTILWIVAITNAVNLIDGLDGLAAGISSIAAVSLVFVAIMVGEERIALIALIIAGACFGFLPFNFNPATIFLGDTGSTFLGYMLAVLSVQGGFKSYAVITFAVPLLILGLPIFDTGFAILRRLFTGKGIMTPDRGHIHHRLVDMGFSQKQTVFILYAISGVLGLTAVVLAESGALRALVLLICVLICVFVGSMMAKRKPHFEDVIPENTDAEPNETSMTLEEVRITIEDENETGGDSNEEN